MPKYELDMSRFLILRAFLDRLIERSDHLRRDARVGIRVAEHLQLAKTSEALLVCFCKEDNGRRTVVPRYLFEFSGQMLRVLHFSRAIYRDQVTPTFDPTFGAARLLRSLFGIALSYVRQKADIFSFQEPPNLLLLLKLPFEHCGLHLWRQVVIIFVLAFCPFTNFEQSRDVRLHPFPLAHVLARFEPFRKLPHDGLDFLKRSLSGLSASC